MPGHSVEYSTSSGEREQEGEPVKRPRQFHGELEGRGRGAVVRGTMDFEAEPWESWRSKREEPRPIQVGSLSSRPQPHFLVWGTPCGAGSIPSREVSIGHPPRRSQEGAHAQTCLWKSSWSAQAWPGADTAWLVGDSVALGELSTWGWCGPGWQSSSGTSLRVGRAVGEGCHLSLCISCMTF